MSSIVFDGTAHTLTLCVGQHKQVGQWYANNVVDPRATLRYVPNGIYQTPDPVHPHRHGGEADTIGGAYGRFGIIRLQPFFADGSLHDDVSVHSGRHYQGGADHPTLGCIRTTDEAMAAITLHILGDPLESIAVLGNYLQHNVHRYPH